MKNRLLILSIAFIIIVLSCRMQSAEVPQIKINAVLKQDALNITTMVNDWPGLWFYDTILIKNLSTNEIFFIDSERLWYPTKREGKVDYFVKQILIGENDFLLKPNIKYEVQVSVESPADSWKVAPFYGKVIFDIYENINESLKIAIENDGKEIAIIVDNVKVIKAH